MGSSAVNGVLKNRRLQRLFAIFMSVLLVLSMVRVDAFAEYAQADEVDKTTLVDNDSNSKDSNSSSLQKEETETQLDPQNNKNSGGASDDDNSSNTESNNANQTGKTPTRTDADPSDKTVELTVTPQGGAEVGSTIEQMTGQAAARNVYYAYSTGGVDGVIIAIPHDSEYANIRLNGSGAADYVTINDSNKDDFDNQLANGDYYIIAIPLDANNQGTELVRLSLSFYFTDGVTPEDTEQSVMGYILEATTASDGQGVVGSSLNVLEGGISKTADESYTLKAQIDEDISVTKTTTGGHLSELGQRTHSEVIQQSNPTHRVSYDVAFKTTGNENAAGRMYQESVTITDTLSGFLSTGLPTEIKISEKGLALKTITKDEIAAGITNGSFTFEIPFSLSKPLTNRTFTVEVTYDKDPYTSMLNGSNTLPNNELCVTSNSVVVENKTVTGVEQRQDTPSTALAAIGWEELDVVLPDLTVQKMIQVGSGQAVPYTEQLQNTYGDPSNPVTFELWKGASIVDQQQINSNGIASFEALEEGDYELRETVGISGRFSKAAHATLVVSENGNGDVIILIDNEDYTTRAYPVTNVDEYVGRIDVDVKKAIPQLQPAADSELPFGDVELALYLGDNPTVGVDQPIATGKTNTSGTYTFDGLDLTQTYTVAVLERTYPGYVVAQQTVKVDSFVDNKATASFLYIGDGGSFTLQKRFIDVDGSVDTSITGYQATFQLYDFSNNAKGGPVGEPIVWSTFDREIVTQYFPSGTYLLVEESFGSVTGVPADKYTKASEDDYNIIHIEEGKYEENAITFFNYTTYGELSIAAFDAAKNPLEGFTYTVRSTSSNYSVPATTGANGIATVKVPEGTYEVVFYSASDNAYAQLDSVGNPIMVEVGKKSAVDIQFAGDATNGYTLQEGPTNAQTAAFMYGFLTDIEAKKTNASGDPVVTAGFSLYELNTTGTAYTRHSTPVFPGINGKLSFTNLHSGSYLLVETLVPPGYVAPSYLSAFRSGSSWVDQIAVADVPTDTPRVDIPFSAYATKDSVIHPDIVNEFKAYVKIAMLDAKSGSKLDGSEFIISDESGTKLGTATTGNDYVEFIDVNGDPIELGAGTYKIQQTDVRDEYVLRTDTITLEVDTDGTVAITAIEDTYKNTKAEPSGNACDIDFSNLLKPTLTIKKQGETNVYSDGKRKVENLEEVEFQVKDSSGKYVIFSGSNGIYEFTSGTTIDESHPGTIITTGEQGNLEIKYFDIDLFDYTLIELSYPKSQGVSYELVTGTVTFDPSNFVTDADGKWIAYKLGLDCEQASKTDEGYTILNKVDLYQIILKKYGLEYNQSENKWEIKKDWEAYNGFFEIYAWNEETNDFTDLVDTLITGSGSMVNYLTAISKQLPAGQYKLVEVGSPVGHKDDAVYNRDTGEWEIQNPNEPLVYYFEIYKDPPASHIDPETGLQIVEIANEAKTGDHPIYGRAFIDKVGYTVDEDGTPIEEGSLKGVAFDVYPAYFSKTTGTYVQLSTSAIQRIYTGTVANIPGGAYSRFVSTEEIKLAILDAGLNFDEILDDIESIGLLLVEDPSTLPSGYEASEVEQYVAMDFDFLDDKYVTNKTDYDWQTNGIPKATKPAWDVPPITIANYRGSGKLFIEKYSGTTRIQGGKFEIYRLNTEFDDSKEFEDLLAAGDLTLVETHAPTNPATAIEVTAGFYYIKEVEAPSGNNPKGTYQVGTKSSLEFDTFIGPIAVSSAELAETQLRVFDQPQASLTLSNTWNQMTTTQLGSGYGDLSAEYELHYSEASAGGPYEVVQEPGVTGSSPATLSGLADGYYYLTEKGIGGSKSDEFIANTSKLVEFQIEGGQAGHFDVYINSSMNEKHITINHDAKGTLIINMGFYNNVGQPVTTYPDSTAFEFEVLKNGEFVSYTSTDPSFHGNVCAWIEQEQRILLEPGTYRIKQVDASDDKYIYDEDYVYVEIGATGYTYLQNNEFDVDGTLIGKASTKDNPLTSADGTARFYNKLNEGVLTVHKAGPMGTESVTATFGIYLTKELAEEGDPTKAERELTTDGGIDSTTLKAGTYYLRELSVEDSYSVRDHVFEVEVIPNTLGLFSGLYDGKCISNHIGIKNAAKISLEVIKYAQYPDGSTLKVSEMPIQLHKKNELTGQFEEVLRDTTAHNPTESGQQHGHLTFSGLSEGEYRVTESKHEANEVAFLDLDEVFESVENSPSIFVKYDTLTDTLTYDVKAQDTEPGSSWNPNDWDANSNTLSIINDYNGIKISVLKSDYDTGAPIVDNNVAFEIYDVDPIENPGVEPFIKEISGSNSEGIVELGNFPEGTYYIVETQAPSGYVLDNRYFPTMYKFVPVDGQREYVIEFKNKKDSTPELRVGKSVKAQSLDASGNPITTDLLPLATNAIQAQYTITQHALNNALPVANYQLVDEGLAFYSDTTGTNPVTGPTYSVESVVVGPAESKKTSPDGSFEDLATPVYAKVIISSANPAESVTSDWLLLDQARAFTPGSAVQNAAGVRVSYSDTGADVNPQEVGPEFVPSDVVINTVIQKYVQSGSNLTPEVMSIENTAQAKTDTLQSNAVSCILPLGTTELGELAITKSLKSPSLQTDIKPGDTLTFSIEVTNPSFVSVERPIIIDRLESEVMFLKQTGNAYAYTISGPGFTNADATLRFGANANAGGTFNNVLIWEFAKNLEPGETIEIEFEVELADIIVPTHIGNYAFATSAADLVYSESNLDGASFTAAPGQEFVNSDPELTELDEYVGSSRGLYVKAQVLDIPIARKGSVGTLKSIGTDGTNWNPSSSPQPVYSDGKIWYRLQFKNDEEQLNTTLENIKLVDVLPFVNDAERGTTWTADVLNELTFDANVKVVNADAGNPIQASTIKYYDTTDRESIFDGTANEITVSPGTKLGDVQALIVDLGNYKLESGDVITVSFSLSMPSESLFDEALYLDNVGKLANNRFYTQFIFSDSPDKAFRSESNLSKAELAKDASISGTVWLDANRNGLIDSEDGLENVIVDLQKLDGTYQTVDSTFTDSNGKYSFTGLDTLYDDSASYKVVFKNPDTAEMQFTVGVPFDGTKNQASHVVNSAEIGGIIPEGNTGPLSLYAKDASNVINAGFIEQPQVIYHPGIAGGEATNVPDAEKALAGEIYYISTDIPVWIDHDFVGWGRFDSQKHANYNDVDESDLVATPSIMMPYEDVTLVALWKELDEVRIDYVPRTFTEDNEAISDGTLGGQTYPAANIIKPQSGNPSSVATANEYYEFIGWYHDEDCLNEIDDSAWVDGSKITPQKPNGDYVDAVYYAKFREITDPEKMVPLHYEVVTLDQENQPMTNFTGGSLDIYDEYVPVLTGKPEGSTATAEQYYTFLGWYSADKELLESDEHFKPTKEGAEWKEATYYAVFRETTDPDDEMVWITYDVKTFDLNDFDVSDDFTGGKVDPEEEPVAVATGVALGSDAEAFAHYDFMGWYEDDGTLVTDNIHFTPTKDDDLHWEEDLIYYAHFKESADPDKLVTLNYETKTFASDGITQISQVGGIVKPPSEKLSAITGQAEGALAEAQPHYEFLGWYDSTGTLQYTDQLAFVPSKADNAAWIDGTTYYAHFKEIDDPSGNMVNLYYDTKTFDKDGIEISDTFTGGSVNPEQEKVAVATGIASGSLATTNDYYKFIGWFDANGTELSLDTQFAPTKATSEWINGTTYYAHFQELQDPTDEDMVVLSYATKTFDQYGNNISDDFTGGTVEPTSERIPVATGIAKGSKADVREFYTFLGWFDEQNNKLGDELDFKPSKAADIEWRDTTYYAHFQETYDPQSTMVTLKYEVKTFTSDGQDVSANFTGGEVDPTSEPVAIATGVTSGSTATAYDFYTFIGWFDEQGIELSDSLAFAPSKEADKEWVDGTTFYAHYKEIDDPVDGEMVTLNYRAKTFDAANNEIQFTGGTVDPTEENVAIITGVPDGSRATAEPFYEFIGWYDETGSLITGNGEIKPVKDADQEWVDGTTFYAYFQEITVGDGRVLLRYATKTFDKDGNELTSTFTGGSVSPDSERVRIATGVAEGSTATARDYYDFLGWYDDSEQLLGDNEFFRPNKSVQEQWIDGTTYYAHFQEREDPTDRDMVELLYTTRTFDQGGNDISATFTGGSVNPVSERVAVATGAAQGSTAAARNHYQFIGWFAENGDALGTDLFYQPTKSADAEWVKETTYYAHFQEIFDPSVERMVQLNYDVKTFTADDQDVSNQFVGGKVDPTGERVAIATGLASGSEASANEFYRFIGWFDASGNPLATTYRFAPSKAADQEWVDGTTYYAHFKEIDNPVDGDMVNLYYRTRTFASDGTTLVDYTGGTVNPSSETLAAITGAADGSTATANGYYSFVGWYNEAGTRLSTELRYIPTKNASAEWVDGTTYYAHFVEATAANLPVASNGYAGIYDAQTHGITVRVTDPAITNARITYSTSNLYTNVTNGSVRVNYTVRIPNHTPVTGSETVTITPRGITVSANNVSKTTGQADPQLTYRSTAGIAGEVPGFRGSLTRASGESVGSYLIGRGSLSLANNGAFRASNYVLNFNNGVLTITAPGTPVIPVVPPGGEGGGGVPGPGGEGGIVPGPAPDDGTLIPYADTPLAGPAQGGDDGELLEDDETPLASPFEDDPWCWVHYWMFLGILVTIIYIAAVVVRRRKFTNELDDYDDEIINGSLGSTTIPMQTDKPSAYNEGSVGAES